MIDLAVKTQIRNLDNRMSRIEQILPTLATKDDLRIYATKEDLRIYATKEDLKAYATRDDLREALKTFATKEDLEAMARQLRTEIQESRRESRAGYRDLKSDIETLAGHLVQVLERLERIEHRL